MGVHEASTEVVHFGVPVEYRWSTGGVPVEYRWSTGGVPVEYRWSTGGVPAEYRRSTDDENQADGKTDRDVTALKAALAKALVWGLLDTNPLAGLKPAKVDNISHVRYLDPDEEIALRHALRERDTKMKTDRRNGNQWRKERGYSLYPDLDRCAYADHMEPLVLLAINTGLRRGELFNLQWGDVSFHPAVLTVRSGETEGNKTVLSRRLPLNAEALDVLRGWKAQSVGNGLVCPGRDGQRMTDIKTAWRTIIKAAKVTDFHFHDLRHHFASRLVMAGVDLNAVRELLGHSDIKMTLRYAHLAPEHKAAAVRVLGRPTDNVTNLPVAVEA